MSFGHDNLTLKIEIRTHDIYKILEDGIYRDELDIYRDVLDIYRDVLDITIVYLIFTGMYLISPLYT